MIDLTDSRIGQLDGSNRPSTPRGLSSPASEKYVRQANFRELREGEVRRILPLGSRVNKGKKKGRDPYTRTPASLYPLALAKGDSQLAL